MMSTSPSAFVPHRRRTARGDPPRSKEAPWIANAVGEKSRADRRVRRQRIVGRNPIGACRGLVGSADVDAENLRQPGLEVLSIALGRVSVPDVAAHRAAAVPDGHVEVSVGTEGDASSVVIEVGFVHFQQDPFGGRIHLRRKSSGRENSLSRRGAIEVGRDTGPSGSGVNREDPAVGLGNPGCRARQRSPRSSKVPWLIAESRLVSESAGVAVRVPFESR